MNWTLLVATILFIITALGNAQYNGSDDGFSCPDYDSKHEHEKLDFYELMGLNPRKLDPKAIRRAYRNKAQIWHPDKIKTNETTLSISEINNRFATLGEAYQTLSDDRSRMAYNRFLKSCNVAKKRKSSSSRRNSGRQYSSYQTDNQQRSQQRRTRPSSVETQQEMLVDPVTGFPILRVTTYDEFHAQNYYRVTIQDYDTFHHPLYSKPQVVEEGPLYPPSYSSEKQRQSRKSGYSEQSSKQHGASQDTLVEGDFLRATQSLYSDNGKHRAYLENCQLVIESRREMEFGPEIFVVWRSPNEAAAYGAECFLALEQSQLVIAGGSAEFRTGHVLWVSNVDDDDHFDGLGSMYFARLEADGVLVVYHAGRWAGKEQEICVFATSSFGCLRPGQHLRQASQFVHAKLALAVHALRAKYNDLEVESHLSDISQRIKQKIHPLLHKIHNFEASNGGDILARLYLFANQKKEKLFKYYSRTVEAADGGLLSNILHKVERGGRKLNRSRIRIESKLQKRIIRLVRDALNFLES